MENNQEDFLYKKEEDPIYVMTVELEKGKSETIKIFQNSKPEFLAYEFNFNRKQFLMGKYLMESFLIDLKNTKYNSSMISCACAYIVMKFFKMKNYQDSYNKKWYSLHNKNTEHSVKECAKDICLFVDNVHKTSFQACFKKYSKKYLEQVSLIILGK